MPHLSTGRSGLRMGAKDQGLPTTPMHPQPTLKRTFYASTAYPQYGSSCPSCEGKLPLRSLLSRTLREGRRSGIMGEQRQTTIWRSGCRGAMAHRAVSAVSRLSCEGTLPVRSLLLRRLREGRQSGRSWGNGDGRRGRQVRRVRFPTRRHPPPPPTPYPATLGGGGAEVVWWLTVPSARSAVRVAWARCRSGR